MKRKPIRRSTSSRRAFVRDIVRTTDEAFEPGRGRPLHPEDRSGRRGNMLALTTLAKAHDLKLHHDYTEAIVANSGGHLSGGVPGSRGAYTAALGDYVAKVVV